MTPSTFPLRFRQERIRALVREVAEREGISQNELLEQAAEHELIVRGALLVDDLTAALRQATELSARTYAARVEASIDSFAEGEGRLDPMQARKYTRPRRSRATSEGLGAVAAFRHA